MKRKAFGLLSALLAGCGAPVGELQSAVYNGAPQGANDRVALVSASGGLLCTGTMITNTWTLTAAHCVGAGVQSVTLNGQTRTVSRIVPHPSLDFALVLLTSPMTINGSTTGFKSSMYTFSAESLDGKAVQLQGFGGNQCNGAGAGTLRYGNERGAPATYPAGSNQWGSLDQYNTPYTTTDGTQSAPGDSGGPYFYTFNGVKYQTGIVKTSQCPSNPSVAARSENFEPWVFGVIYNAPTPVPTTNQTATLNNWSHQAADQNQGVWNLAVDYCDLSAPENKVPCLIRTGATCAAPSDCAGYTPTGTVTCYNGRCVDQQLWTRPLPAWSGIRCTWKWDPCPGSSNYYRYTIDYSMNPGDSVTVGTDYQSNNFTGTNNYWLWGRGDMHICYSTSDSGTSPGVNWMNVQCCNKPGAYQTCNDTPWIQQNEQLVCHGARCGNTIDPLPPGFYQVATWNPCGGGAFWYFLDYSTVYPDNIWFSSGEWYSGTGHVNWVYEPGPVQLSIATDSANHYSHGIRSLTAVCVGW